MTMQFIKANKNDMDIGEILGLSVKSKLSQIRALCQDGISLDALLNISSDFAMIESGLFSLVTLASMNDDNFDKFHENLNEKYADAIKICTDIRELAKTHKEKAS